MSFRKAELTCRDAASEDLIELHEDSIIAAVRIALVDDSGLVRMAAAKTFDSMQHYIGTKAIDETIPTLLEAMRQPGATSETALMALKEVMSVRANSVFPVLIPTLTAQPITAFNARALGALVQVAGSALSRRIPQVLGALVKSLEAEKAEDVREELQSAIEALLRSVEDTEGLHSLQMTLLSWYVSLPNSADRQGKGPVACSPCYGLQHLWYFLQGQQRGCVRLPCGLDSPAHLVVRRPSARRRHCCLGSSRPLCQEHRQV